MSYVMVAVAGVNALQQVQAGRGAKAMANVQAQGADWQAQQEREQALQTAMVIRRAGQRQTGQARAALAASGVRVDEGTAALVQQDITRNAEMDAFQALLEGGRRARTATMEATGMRISGDQTAKAGQVQAMGTLLSGFAQGARASGWKTGGSISGTNDRPWYSRGDSMSWFMRQGRSGD